MIAGFLCAVGLFVLSIWFCWALFLSAMTLKRAKENNRLTLCTKILGYPFIAGFVFFDFAFNVIFGSILFLKYPQDLLFTQRLNRYIREQGWRHRLAIGICRTLLDNFDPDGAHCHEK